jgi:acid phosphatase
MFLVVGDWGMDTPELRKVARQMGTTAAAEDCRFVISVGDNFYSSGVSGVRDPLWQERFESVFSAPALQCPWYAVLGNHDHRGSIQAEVAYHGVDSRWNMPGRYFARQEPLSDGSHADFFYIDTNPIEHPGIYDELFSSGFAAAQMAWLEEELRGSRAAWKFVAGHHTIFSGGQHGTSDRMVRAVKPLLDRYGVAAYLNGHDHDLQHIVMDGIHYITSGAGAETTSVTKIEGSLFAAARPGFLAAQLRPDELAFRFIGSDGSLLYSSSFPPRS